MQTIWSDIWFKNMLDIRPNPIYNMSTIIIKLEKSVAMVLKIVLNKTNLTIYLSIIVVINSFIIGNIFSCTCFIVVKSSPSPQTMSEATETSPHSPTAAHTPSPAEAIAEKTAS